MKIKLLLILMLCQFSLGSFACESFFGSEKLKVLITGIQNSKDVWEGYSPAKKPVVVTDMEKSSECVAIYNGTTWSFMKLRNPLYISNGVFDFYPYSQDNLELKEHLLSLGISRTVVMSLHNYLGNLLSRWPGGESGLYFTVLIHEGFHLHAQLGNQEWPKWVSQVEADRDRLVDECYKPYKKLLHNELKVLLDSFKSNDELAFRNSIQSFIFLRDMRYNLYPSCRDMEASWEMIEGVAEYVGWKSSLQQFITKSDLLKYFEAEFERSREEEDTEYFYHLGALQLFAINRINNNIFQQHNPLMRAQNTKNDNIYNLLKLVLKH